MTKKLEKEIEEARSTWANVAKQGNWYTEPFYVHVWINSDDEVIDAVSHKGMTKDIIEQDEDEEDEED